MDLTMITADEPVQPTNQTHQIVELYRGIVHAAVADVNNWLLDDGVSRAIPEAIPDAILVTDEAGMIVLDNSSDCIQCRRLAVYR